MNTHRSSTRANGVRQAALVAARLHRSRIAYTTRILFCPALLLAVSTGGCIQHSDKPPPFHFGESKVPLGPVAMQNARALSAFGRVFELMQSYSPPVSPKALFVHSVQGMGQDPRLSGAADKAIVNSTLAAIENSRTVDPYDMLYKLNEVIEPLSTGPGKPTVTTLVERGLRGMTDWLDRSTYYIPQCDTDDDFVRKERIGRIGLEGTGLNGRVVVCPGLPSSKVAGPGPRSAEQIFLAGLPAQSPPAKAAPVFGVLIGSWIYLQLSHLGDGADVQLQSTLDRLRNDAKGSAKGIVLDLRSNDGGLIDSAVGVANLFLNKGAEIVGTTAVSPSDCQRFDASPGDVTSGLPLAVLVNHRTASGAEIIAGALQDNGRAVIIGTTTLGRGSVQTVVPDLALGRLVLTTAYVTLPSRRKLQDLGVRPDLELWPTSARQLALWVSQPTSRDAAKWVGIAKRLPLVPSSDAENFDPMQPQDDPAVEAAIVALMFEANPSANGLASRN